MPEATTPDARIYVVQARWLGNDDWTNDVFAATTKEEAEAIALDCYNTLEAENAQDEGRTHTPWASLQQIADENPDFLFDGFYV